MKKLIKNLFNTFLIVSSLALVSCNNIMHNDEEQKSLTKITLTATVDLGDTSRKAVPEDYSLYDSLTYKLKATCNTDNSYSIEPFFGTPEIELELVAANWSFELTAYNAGNTPIFRSSENVNIDITEDTVLNFKMVGVANGVLEYKFSLPNENEKLEPYENPVLVFEVYGYNGSIQNTINAENKLTLSGENYTNELVRIPNTSTIESDGNPTETTVYSYFRSISINLPEGKYYVICKKAARSDVEPVVNEETVTEDDLNFFFQELVEIKAGLTTTSGYNDISSTSPEYKITLYTDGGNFDPHSLEENITNEKYVYNYSINTTDFDYKHGIGIPIKKVGEEYYAFLGWYYDKALTKPAYSIFGDSLNFFTSSSDKYIGNFELYAKWAETPAPKIIVYGNSEYKENAPIVTSNWNINLGRDADLPGNVENSSPKINVIADGQPYYAFNYLDPGDENKFINAIYTDNTKKYVLNEGTERNVEIKKLCYDNKLKQFVAFMDVNAEGSADYIITLSGEDKKEYSIGGVENVINNVDAMAVYNNIVWLVSGKYVYKFKLVNSIAQKELEISIIDFLRKYYPDFIEGEDIRKEIYVAITDFCFTEDGTDLYASLKITGSDFNYKEVAGKNCYLSFGDLLLINQTDGAAQSLIPYNFDDSCSVDSVLYYGIKSHRDTSCLAGPTRIYAIKEKELVMADEGAFYWQDESNKKFMNEINRVVVYNLENNSIKYVCPVDYRKNDLEGGWVYNNTGSCPSGFEVVHGSTSYLF